MSTVLSLTVPFFALIFLGMFCRHIGFVGDTDAKTMARFAFFIAMPTMVFIKIGAGNALDFLNWGFIWRYELATIVIFIIAALVARPLFSLTRLESGMFGLNAAYPNYGYIGVPLAILALGDQAALPLALILALDTVVLLVLAGWFATTSGGALGRTIRHALVTVSRNPLRSRRCSASPMPPPGSRCRESWPIPSTWWRRPRRRWHFSPSGRRSTASR